VHLQYLGQYLLYRTASLISACDEYVALSPLSSNTTCHLFDFCTGVRCCTEVGFIRQSLNTFLIIDNCNYKLAVGIEKLEVNTSLHSYVYGTTETVMLNGVVRLQ
jgi:hypothetical protein